MQLQIQTSSTEMIPIEGFKYLYDLARISKCQMFVLLKYTNKLYGGTADYGCVHEIDVPFLVNTDLIFRLDSISDKEILNYDSFFIPDAFKYVILPGYYWTAYQAGDLDYSYDTESQNYVVTDKATHQPIEQIPMTKVVYTEDFDIKTFLGQVEGFIARQPMISHKTYSFVDMEKDETIRTIFDGKADIGAVPLILDCDGNRIIMYLSKGLFSLAKTDKLSIDIRFDRYQSRLFMATFKPIKKKNPLTFNTYGVPYQEKIHCMFMNVR